MKHVSFTCDRCTEVFVKETKYSKFKIMSLEEIKNLKGLDKYQQTTSYLVLKYTNMGLDLCDKCNNQLENWLNNPERKMSE